MDIRYIIIIEFLKIMIQILLQLKKKKNENDYKVNNDFNNIGCNKKFYNKSIINKYKTINNNFLKQKINLNKNADKNDSISKISNKTINKQNSVKYINNRSEGNSNHKKRNIKNENDKEQEKEELMNNNQIKIPLLVIKNKTQLLKPSGIFIPRNCISAKNRRKLYQKIKIWNIAIIIIILKDWILIILIIINNLKKFFPLITNSNSNETNNINTNINCNQKKRLRDILGYKNDINQIDKDNKETNNTSEKGKTFTYNKKWENKFHFNF